MPTPIHNFDLRLDSHKLMLHPQRVADWLAGKNIAPIYMEVSPSGACNHRCAFCGKDFMGYQKRFIPLDLWRERVKDMGEAGVKAITFAGEGEPFMHEQMEEMALSTHKANIDVAFATNAVLMAAERSERVIPFASWIKVSFNAGTPETYARIHRAKKQDFATALDNMEAAVKIRQATKSQCVLGFQMLLLPENMSEAIPLARRVRDIGCDYLVIKPYSQHPLSHTHKYSDIRYDSLDELENELNCLGTQSFRPILRKQTAVLWNAGAKTYSRCIALPFWAYVDAGCSVWGCSMFLGDERWRYGNLCEESFTDIWNGEKRKQNLGWVANSLDAKTCRVNCRMDKINIYLHELLGGNPHANFI